MADITGPINTLPGARHKLPAGAMCDGYNCECNKPAVKRIQGETDSFGSELNDFCEDCLKLMEADEEAERATPRCCDWCKTMSTTVRPARDYNEGSSGPLYDVCSPCRQKQLQELHDEMAEDDPFDNNFYD